VSLCSCVLLNKSEYKNCGYFKESMRYIDIISSDTSANKQKLTFLFHDDYSGYIIDAIRSGTPNKSPQLRICTFYKNMLGACFNCEQIFQLYGYNNDQDKILENWQCQISAFQSMLKNEIVKMNNLRGKDSASWSTIFQESKQKYNSTIVGENQKLKAIQLPTRFKISPMSEEDYNSVIEKSNYSQYMPESARSECTANGIAQCVAFSKMISE
jgi:hypothetical protein